MRLIDADALIMHLNDWALSVSGNDTEYEDVQAFIKCVAEWPSANQWIRCDIRLPDIAYIPYLIAYEVDCKTDVSKSYWYGSKLGWSDEGKHHKVLAWRWLPKYEDTDND